LEKTAAGDPVHAHSSRIAIDVRCKQVLWSTRDEDVHARSVRFESTCQHWPIWGSPRGFPNDIVFQIGPDLTDVPSKRTTMAASVDPFFMLFKYSSPAKAWLTSAVCVAALACAAEPQL
jgi:hypothetical protein